ncbi:rod-binding protein [Kozakia baliensis]|uniref:rod-binding protein n=1 Tax=Kozakia baliensis TaxID=153496 RepID=UPI00087D5DBD|nr:rod-binding protein [Kozakia baliensis]AOX19155.1 chemotaxis protein chel [Kozakia baliensis]
MTNIPPVSKSHFSNATSEQSQAKTWKAAQDFEAMTINQMLQPMFATVNESGGMFDGGAGEKQFKPMLINEVAKEMEHTGGLGLATAIYQKMLAMQEKK